MSIPWSEASSVIIAAKDDTTKVGFKILLTKRAKKSSYLANAYCFPGGHIEKDDFSGDWWAVFREHGVTRGELLNCPNLMLKDVTRPPILTNPQVLLKESRAKDFLPSEIALRISALRETFEETGILIAAQDAKLSCSDVKSVPSTSILKIHNVREWQQKVHDDPITFIELFQEVQAVPDIWSVKEWWNWLTPPTVGHKRFDTMFYLCCLDSMPASSKDDTEVSAITWMTPEELLVDHLRGNSFLAPPQVYETARLANFTSLQELKSFAHHRQKWGVERWCANVTGLSDGALLALPGDECFDLQLTSERLPCLNEMKRKKMNRMELKAPVFTPICSNLDLPGGHLCPISVDPKLLQQDDMVSDDDDMRGGVHTTPQPAIRLTSNL